MAPHALGLGLESLETRLNLSLSTAIPAIGALPLQSHITSYNQFKRIAVTSAVGATALSSSTTGVPISSYSAIYNCQLESRSSGQDIGWVSTSGAYVEYQVTAASAGTYQLALGLASASNASMNISVNGSYQASLNIPATGSWDSYVTRTQSIQLAAGTNTIRLASTNSTQYNLQSVALTPAGAGSAVSSSGTTSVPLTSYAAISNCQLETRSSGQDIGWVSTSGAYVDYKLNVAQAGTYNLSLGLAGTNSATMNVYANGSLVGTVSIPATGSWDSYTTVSKAVALPAGAVTLRLASANGTQYNLNAITLAPASISTTSSTSGGGSVSASWMTSFNQLNIAGTSSNDSIYVSQSGATLYVNINGQTSSYTSSYGDLVIHGRAGNDTITVDSSVWVPTLVYADTGSDTIKNLTHGKATIVAIGNGYDSVQGNGVNTSFWVDPGDSVNASSAEWNTGRVHQVSSFYGGVSTQLLGQNLADPSGTGSTTRLTNSSFWGTGPTDGDVLQGQAADCYYLAPLAAFARTAPDRLQEMAVDLGDGTYAVQYVRGGVKTFVRVDGDLPAGGPYGNGLNYAHLGASGNQWAPLMEKAYAIFRSGSWSYSSLNYGYASSTYSDLGVSYNSLNMSTDANTAYNTLSAALSSRKPVATASAPSINGAPLVASHAYSVVSANKDAWGNVSFTLRNPWGFDGAGSDSNTSDGLVTLTWAQLQANTVGTVIAI